MLLGKYYVDHREGKTLASEGGLKKKKLQHRKYREEVIALHVHETPKKSKQLKQIPCIN